MVLRRSNHTIQDYEKLFYAREPKQLVADGVLFKVDWNSTVSSSSTADLHITTSDADFVHVIERSVQFDGASSITAEVYESPTVNTKGSTSLTSYNFNRNSSKVSSVQFITDTTFTETGTTKIDLTRIPTESGSVGALVARTSDLNKESGNRILKPGEDYLLRLTNNDASNDANFTVKIIYYEGALGS